MNIAIEYIRLPEIDLRVTIDEDALDELADSLRDRGQLQAIGVRPIHPTLFEGKTAIDPQINFEGFIRDGGTFEVVYGARRFRAAGLIGWTEIRCEIADEIDEVTTAANKLIENVQREQLTPIEEAYAMLNLIGNEPPEIRKLQRQTGKSRAWILSRLALVEMPPDIQGAVQAGAIGLGVAKALGAIENAEVREQYVRHAIENGCTEDQATIWASQARWAESGIVAMDQLEKINAERGDAPPIVEQVYKCFVCTSEVSWRRINPLNVCGPCQEAVISTRHTSHPDPTPSPLDTLENGA